MVIGLGTPGDAVGGSGANDPFRNTGVEKQFSQALKDKVIKNSRKSKLVAMTMNGNRISGSFFLVDNIRPSDFLRNMETKRVLLVEASINGIEQSDPVLIIIDNCQYISLLDDYDVILG